MNFNRWSLSRSFPFSRIHVSVNEVQQRASVSAMGGGV